MGYESKFYIIEKEVPFIEKLGRRYGTVIAIFDMGKLGYGSKTLARVEKSPFTDSYIYADDGNTKILKDRYGDQLKEITLPDLIRALKEDDDGYRRIKPFVAFLETILKEKKFKNVVALHYGY